MVAKIDKNDSLLQNPKGVEVAVVTDNHDPDNLGRVKVKSPARDDSFWVRVASFMGGKDRGGYFLPEVDDEVLIAFIGGDIRFPVVIGSLWSSSDTPPINNDDGENNIRIIKSRSGHSVVFDDTSGKEKISLSDKNGNSIEIDSSKNEISIKSNAKISLIAKEIEIKADATLRLNGQIVRIN